MAACWVAFFAATAALFPEPPKRLPIGLARDSMLLDTAADGRSPAGGAVSGGLGARRGSGPAGPQRAQSQLRQPLLERVPAEEGLSQADAELAPAGAEPLLPHAVRAEQQEAALHKDPGAERKAAAAWRASLPGTIACTLALFVQKMVGGWVQRAVGLGLCWACCACWACMRLPVIAASRVCPLRPLCPLRPQVQQGYMDGLPVFANLLFGWRAKQAGLFLGLGAPAGGSCALPVPGAVVACPLPLRRCTLGCGSSYAHLHLPVAPDAPPASHRHHPTRSQPGNGAGERGCGRRLCPPQRPLPGAGLAGGVRGLPGGAGRRRRRLAAGLLWRWGVSLHRQRGARGCGYLSDEARWEGLWLWCWQAAAGGGWSVRVSLPAGCCLVRSAAAPTAPRSLPAPRHSAASAFGRALLRACSTQVRGLLLLPACLPACPPACLPPVLMPARQARPPTHPCVCARPAEHRGGHAGPLCRQWLPHAGRPPDGAVQPCPAGRLFAPAARQHGRRVRRAAGAPGLRVPPPQGLRAPLPAPLAPPLPAP